MPLVALLTDFGMRDPYVGVMKGVLLGLSPRVQIVDLTHDITPQNVWQGCFALGAAVSYFPPNTIYVCVVDPGVGTTRCAVLVQTARSYFIAPDNGLLTMSLQREEPVAAFNLNRAEFFLPHVSTTFHGRDIFAPVAGHLAEGRSPHALGEPLPLDKLMKLTVKEPTGDEQSMKATVLYVDRFGNLVTNVQQRHLGSRTVEFVAAGKVRAPLKSTYQSVAAGRYLCLWGSFGYLEISESMGNASQTLGLREGSEVVIILGAPSYGRTAL